MNVRAVAVGLALTLALALGCGEPPAPVKTRPEALGMRFLKDPEQTAESLKGKRYQIRGKVLAGGATRLLLEGGRAKGEKLPALACEFDGETSAVGGRAVGSFVEVTGTFDRYTGSTLVLVDCAIVP